MLNDCTSVDDVVFVGLTVVHIAREDPQDKRSLQGALSQETTSRATQWVPLYPYGFSCSFGGVFRPALRLDYPIDFSLILIGFVIVPSRG